MLPDDSMLLEVNKLSAGYGEVPVLKEISLKVGLKEAVGIIGPNAAGKSTLLKAISGLVKISSGSITFDGKRIDKMQSHQLAELGISHVLAEGGIFPMTVLENLELGAYISSAREKREESLKEVFDIFPDLEKRKNQVATTLSGGERRMLSFGRGLMIKPRLLMLDEPSFGLAPILVTKIFKVIEKLHKMGIAVLLLEQNVPMTLELVDRAYVLENGQIVMEGTGKKLSKDPQVQKSYLGI